MAALFNFNPLFFSYFYFHFSFRTLLQPIVWPLSGILTFLSSMPQWTWLHLIGAMSACFLASAALKLEYVIQNYQIVCNFAALIHSTTKTFHLFQCIIHVILIYKTLNKQQKCSALPILLHLNCVLSLNVLFLLQLTKTLSFSCKFLKQSITSLYF